jgi:hypothetical protein
VNRVCAPHRRGADAAAALIDTALEEARTTGEAPAPYPAPIDPRADDGVSQFRYLLALESGEPADPAMFVTAVPDWHIGDTFWEREQ